MKKMRIIALTLIISLGLMGAGYAYWTDTLTINNTVSTGELKVEFDKDFCFGFLPGIISADNVGEDYIERDILQSEDNKTLTVTVNNMYPNSMALYAAKLENKGSIPAVFDDVEVTFTKDNDKLKQHLMVAGGYMLMDKNNQYKQGDVFWGSLNELQTKLNDMFANVRMEPGDYLLLDIPPEYQYQVKEIVEPYNPEEQNCIIFYMPESIVNEDGLEDQETIFDIKLNFKQHNAQ